MNRNIKCWAPIWKQITRLNKCKCKHWCKYNPPPRPPTLRYDFNETQPWNNELHPWNKTKRKTSTTLF